MTGGSTRDRVISTPAEPDDLDCGGCGVLDCPYCSRDPNTIDLVAAYLSGGHLYQAVLAGIGGDDPRFWAGLRANPPLPFALFELVNVPRELASRLVAHGTDDHPFENGVVAAAAARPFLARRIYAHPSYTD